MSLLSFSFWSSVLLLFAQWVCGTYLVDQIWGLHHLTFLSPRTSIALCLGALLLLVMGRWNQSLWRPPASGVHLSGRILLPGVALIALSLFYFGRIRHHLFGDASLIASLVDRPHTFQLFGQNDLYFHSLLYRLFSSFTAWEAHFAFILTSCLSGTVCVIAMLSLAHRARNKEASVLAFVVLISTGAVELFFGYVEHYTLMTVGLVLSLHFIVRWRGRSAGELAAAIACWIVSFTFHPLSLFAAPTILLALLLHVRNRLRPLGALLLPTVMAVVLGYWFFNRPELYNLLLPFHLTNPYALFSGAHLRDFLNEYLLLVPLHGALCAFLLYHKRHAIRWKDPVLLCLGLCLVSGLATSFIIEPKLGSLDWDLLSVYAFPLAILLAYIVGEYTDSGEAVKRSAVCFAAGALLHIVPWIAVNADQHLAANMVTRMVAQDFHHRGERNMKLGAKFMQMGLLDAAVHQYRRAVEWSADDDVAHFNLGWTYYKQYCMQQRPTLDLALQHLQHFVDLSADVDSRLARGVIAMHSGDASTGAVLCSFFLLDLPVGSEEELKIARRFSAMPLNPRDEKMLTSALAFAEREFTRSALLCRELTDQYPRDRTVLTFRDELRRRMLVLRGED